MQFETVFELVVFSLAAARIAVLLVHDTILDPIRGRIFLRWPPEDNASLGYTYQRIDRQGRTLPGGVIRTPVMTSEMLTCTRCMTVWMVAAIYTLDAAAGSSVALLVATPIAAMSIAAWVAKRI